MAGAVTQSTVSGGVAVTSQSAFTGIKSVSGGNYTVLDDDGYHTIQVPNNGANRTITLPTAADNTGRRLTIQKTGSDAFTVVVDGEGAETIDGAASITLYGRGSAVCLLGTASGWEIVGWVAGAAVAYTPTWTNITLSNGSTTGFFRQIAPRYFQINCEVTFGSSTSVGGTISPILPNSLAVDMAAISTTHVIGTTIAFDNSTSPKVKVGVASISGSGAITSGNDGADTNANATVPMTWANGDVLRFDMRVPTTL